jgi:probable phosphoglycerate mutase
MILPKEFYFVRHGQTDHNISEKMDKGGHSEEIPLNETGRLQAQTIEPLIASLQVKAVVSSPMIRVQETKEIITPRLNVPHYEMNALGECSDQVWKEMRGLKMGSPIPEEGDLFLFLERMRKGLNAALSLSKTPLIVAHGGIHWATCFLMQIEEYDWSIHNCGVVHFFVKEKGKWGAKRL